MQKRSKRLCLVLAVLLSVSMGLVALAPAVEAASYKKGSSGAVVTQIQTKLKSWGYYTGTVDGIYGSGTERAVRAFQQKNGLTVDGKAGDQTLAAMGLSAGGGNSSNSGGSGGASSSQVDLLARLISAEARGGSRTPARWPSAPSFSTASSTRRFRIRSPASSIRAARSRASRMGSSISRSRRAPTAPRAMHSTASIPPAARSIISIRPRPPARGSGRGRSSRSSGSTGSAPECPETAQNRGCGSTSPLHIAGQKNNVKKFKKSIDKWQQEVLYYQTREGLCVTNERNFRKKVEKSS